MSVLSTESKLSRQCHDNYKRSMGRRDLNHECTAEPTLLCSEGSDPNGRNIYIEVKSIDYVGQKFRMTNNEFAAAQYKPGNYYLALVYQNKDSFEISLIKDPVNRLNLTRQVLQWVWECTDYEYKPMRFKI